MGSGRTEAGAALAVLLLGSTLAFVGKTLVDVQETSALSGGLTSLVGIGVTAFGTLVLTWWCLGFCFAIAAELLVRRGRLKAARRIGVLAPAFMRRAVCLALGVNLIAVPSAYAGVIATVPSAGQHIHAADELSALSPQWVPVEAVPARGPSWRPTAPPPGGGLLIKEAHEGRFPTAGQDEVVVQPGDSLWAITARYLGPATSDAQVAEAWPQWYAANRDVIGQNPELLQPGQVLHPPAGTPTASK